jgi:hypothetical protein
MDEFSTLGSAEDDFIMLNITLIHPILTGKKLKAHTTIEFFRPLCEDLPPYNQHNEAFLTTEKQCADFLMVQYPQALL